MAQEWRGVTALHRRGSRSPTAGFHPSRNASSKLWPANQATNSLNLVLAGLSAVSAHQGRAPFRFEKNQCKESL